MNGYEEKIKDRLFLEVCNAAGREGGMGRTGASAEGKPHAGMPSQRV